MGPELHLGRYVGIHTEFSLHDEAPGGGDRGSVYQMVPGKGEIWVDVNCVYIVSDSEVHWSGTVVEATGDYVTGLPIVGWAKDVSTPGSAGDMIGSYYYNAGSGPAEYCGSFTGGGTVTGGNLKIHPITTP